MLSRFLNDRRGNYALITAITSVPLLGALALGVDYTEMSRQRQATLNALDAAGIATARRAVEGATEAELLDYAQQFFRANLGSLDPQKATLSVVLPSNNLGGGTLKLSAELRYDPYFMGAFSGLLNNGEELKLSFNAESEIRLKNTLEVALVLDNSGSMDFNGSGTGRKRMDLLKEAAKQLVDTIALQAAQMKQVNKPVQFALVPFASSVNVGSQHADASWMDRDGRSPIHHENFDWSTFTQSNRKVELSNGIYVRRGTGWGAQNGQKVTRFTLFDELRRVTAVDKVKVGTEYGCIQTNWWGGCAANGWYDVFADVPKAWARYTSWAGCVETRPGTLAYDITPPSATTPATLFVPMFAPDETDLRDGSNRRAMGNWWPDRLTGSDNAARQRDMRKYFDNDAPLGTAVAGLDQGPNGMCSTTPITPLTDVSTTAGLKVVKDAIDAMRSLGATDVPEGVAWGWRVLTSTDPFPHGRPSHEKGNDKVVIVLTDGENTYYTPNSLGYNDLAGNRSIYSNKGYTARNAPGANRTRLFQNTSNTGTHTNPEFTKAMNEHMDTVCEGAKAAGIIVMTVALDLSASKDGEKAAIEALSRCASDSRFRRDPNDPSKAAKLFWNANGSNLADKFREIADELSNLRIVG